MSMTLGQIIKNVVIQKVAKVTNGIRVLGRQTYIFFSQNKEHGGLTNISKNVRGAYMSLTPEPIFKYVVIQKVAIATNGISVLTRKIPYLLYQK